MRSALSFLLLLVACSGSCGPELPRRSSTALGRPAPPLQERTPELNRQLPAPVCEASAILMLSDHTWLVADNEIHQNLFGFTRGFDEATRFEMPSGNRPRDIEALAHTGEGEFLVVGSHSHRRDGSMSRKRHRLRWVRFSHDTGVEEAHFSDAAESRWGDSAGACQAVLFEDSVDGGGELAARFCAALIDAGEMDIEGAASHDGHVWLGFRRPLVQGQAVMARLSGHQLRFDAIQLLDLGGRGIRAMDDHEGRLYVIGGPSDDSIDAHALFVVQEERVRELASLPPFAEGLAVHSPGRALVVTDGAEGSVGCDEPSTVKTITFRDPSAR